jgi:hypothetical protein
MTPDVSVTYLHDVRHCDGCRGGSWEGLTGRTADVCRPTPHDDPRSYGEGDSEVRATRRVTGALRRPLCGNKARGSTISQEVARRFAVASWVIAGAGSSRDGRGNSAKPSLDDQIDQTRDPRTSTGTSKTSAKRRTRRSPMLAHETLPVSGASVVGMT